jgi:tetratricopeptide (TPR) repeat protein
MAKTDPSLDFSFDDLDAIQEKKSQGNELLYTGKAAYDAGDKKRAHELWREAARLDPYNEKTWTALLMVIESPEDRRVCLDNIIAINPTNMKARRALRSLQDREEARRREREAEAAAEIVRRAERRRQLVRRLIFALVMAVLIAIAAAAAIYGTGIGR